MQPFGRPNKPASTRVNKMSHARPRLTSREAQDLLRRLYDIPGSSPNHRRSSSDPTIMPPRNPNLHVTNPPLGNNPPPLRNAPPPQAFRSTSAPQPQVSPNSANIFFPIPDAAAPPPQIAQPLSMTVTRDGHDITLDASARVHGHLNVLSVPSPTYVLQHAEGLSTILGAALNSPNPTTFSPQSPHPTIPGLDISAEATAPRTTIAPTEATRRQIHLHINSSISVLGSRNQIIMSASGPPPPILVAPSSIPPPQPAPTTGQGVIGPQMGPYATFTPPQAAGRRPPSAGAGAGADAGARVGPVGGQGEGQMRPPTTPSRFDPTNPNLERSNAAAAGATQSGHTDTGPLSVLADAAAGAQTQAQTGSGRGRGRVVTPLSSPMSNPTTVGAEPGRSSLLAKRSGSRSPEGKPEDKRARVVEDEGANRREGEGDGEGKRTEAGA